ncbi:TetR/AcrR family transcriptional regulator [Rhodococcus ruber]|uniref:Transcriptional regulator n=1 Tax=Rhodococcus ruber TaxID=1830 RepID=A0A098BET1_9NOCA|nr:MULTISPECIES: TetR/AcrR family transcriptional regulator [Rhodococcus]MDO2377643.1 TetR/AcrR family transcriptional regulator [Rhodococcus ruber]MBC2589246.1 TetR/AcrR family transcriptional regulator [Rhodococcus aetherivorans]MCD2129962.1 TetR/AcrR family transcriptional regulator [Rhodococcus ruber]MCZ4506433.1 TetR/AcrR family transcriptional regulator [Rhodococcus ruber]MCZ4533596.1 TetR/AcrR family transcriptional regulator [Rhodococcus ruber]
MLFNVARSTDGPETPSSAVLKSARTRARIMDAAAKVLSSKGYAKTRLTDIAIEADIQAPAIYYYYPSRQKLIEAVVRHGTSQMNDHVSSVLEALPSTTSPMQRIAAAVEAHLRLSLELSVYTTAAIRNAGQLPDAMRERQRADEEQYAGLWRNLLEEAHAAGEIRPDVDLRAVRMLLLGALNWAAEWWSPERGSLESVVCTAQTLIQNGLSADTPVDMRPIFLAPSS